MTTLNLAHSNLGDIKVTLGMFPDGEPTVKIDSDLSNFQKDVVTIMTRITSPKELFVLQLTADILNRWGIKFNIYVSYLMSHWVGSVETYIKCFSSKYTDTTENYYDFLERMHYAKDPEYRKKVETIRRQLFEK